MGVGTSESPVETAALSVLPHDDRRVGWYCRIAMDVKARNRCGGSDRINQAAVEVSSSPVAADDTLPCCGKLAKFAMVRYRGMSDIRSHDRSQLW